MSPRVRASYEACIRAAVKTAAFPPPENGTATVRIPIMIDAQGP
jgi:hypothetical protein